MVHKSLDNQCGEGPSDCCWPQDKSLDQTQWITSCDRTPVVLRPYDFLISACTVGAHFPNSDLKI